MESTASYLMRRLLWVPVILFIVSAVTFTLARIGPGDPVRVAAGQFRDEEAFARVREQRGLDKPLYEQYVIYMKNVFQGDLGESFRYQDRSVSEIILPAFWRSMQYNSVALFLTIGIGIPVGIYAARHQGGWRDPTVISAFLLIQSISALVSIPVLLWLFSLKLGILPARGWPQDCNFSLPALGDSYECIGIFSTEAIIPLLVLSLPGIAVWARYTRAFTLGAMSEDYVRTARSKGIREFDVMTRHVLRNSLLPLSTIIIFSLLSLLSGSFFVETLTGIPGVGRLAFEAVFNRDYDMIMAFTLIGASAFVLASIAVDIAYTFIDPRIRYGARRY